MMTQYAKRSYYVRVITLNGKGNLIGLPSPPVQIIYDPTPLPPPPDVKLADVSHASCQSPRVRIKAYEPIRLQAADAPYWFIVMRDPYDGAKVLSNQTYLELMGWHVGDHIYLPPKHESKSFWDYLGDFFEGVFGFVEDLVNLISEAWESIKGAVVGVFVNFLKGVGVGCPGWCETALMAGLNAGLVALGIPPDIPNFNELEEMGADYLLETTAAEVIAQSPLPISKDDVKNAARAGLNEMKNQMNQTTSGGSWLMHDYTKDARPAYLVLEAFNPTGTPTDPGYVYGRESLHVFKLDQSVAVPPLPPGATFSIPIFLEPELMSAGHAVCVEVYDNTGR